MNKTITNLLLSALLAVCAQAQSKVSATINQFVAAPPTASAEDLGKLEVGAYLKTADGYLLMQGETADLKTQGGAIKRLKLSLRVAGDKSTLVLQQPAVLVVKTLEGAEMHKAKLYRFRVEKDARLALIGSASALLTPKLDLGVQDNSDTDAVAFAVEKLGNALYRVELKDLGAGEYGLQFPPTQSRPIAPIIFTFRIN